MDIKDFEKAVVSTYCRINKLKENKNIFNQIFGNNKKETKKQKEE